METFRKSGPAATGPALPTAWLLATLLLAIGLAAAKPAQAAGLMNSAEKLRRLDIMLMVTGLRCRTTRDNFTSDYGRFTSRHLSMLNQASRDLQFDLSKRHGEVGAKRAMDRLSVNMANSYGLGHPWLNCAQLKQVARNLANVEGREALVKAADQLLSPRRSPQFAYGAP